MRKVNRRRFMRGALVAAGAGVAPGLLSSSWAKPMGANGDIRLGVIGFNNKGALHINALEKIKGVRVVALCDVDREVLESKVQEFKDKKQKVFAYTDYRKLLENPDIDGVLIATPNHTHAVISIHAVQAGKHVYVEKPVSHNVWEGRQLVAAAEKYGKIIHHGMQRRSDVGWFETFDWLKEGHIGKVTLSRGIVYRNRPSIGKVKQAQEVSPKIDYDLWCGPREVKPLMRKKFHYDWHWKWDYGNGDIGNQGPHQLDVARWVLGDGHDRLPDQIVSIGGRFGYDDDGETPNTQIVFCDYKPVPIIIECTGLPSKEMNWKLGLPNYRGLRVGNVIHCEGGTIVEGSAYDNAGKRIKKFGITRGKGHLEAWMNSMRTGKQDKKHTALVGHLAASLAHCGNIAHRLGAKADPEAIRESVGSKDTLETFDRIRGHLELNGIDISKDLAVISPKLKINPEKERFEGEFAEEANAQLKESYREAFAVPQLA